MTHPGQLPAARGVWPRTFVAERPIRSAGRHSSTPDEPGSLRHPRTDRAPSIAVVPPDNESTASHVGASAGVRLRSGASHPREAVETRQPRASAGANRRLVRERHSSAAPSTDAGAPRQRPRPHSSSRTRPSRGTVQEILKDPSATEIGHCIPLFDGPLHRLARSTSGRSRWPRSPSAPRGGHAGSA